MEEVWGNCVKRERQNMEFNLTSRKIKRKFRNILRYYLYFKLFRDIVTAAHIAFLGMETYTDRIN